MSDISVIVPIYYGRKYIKGIIRQLENCSRQLACSEHEKTVELILVNDAPDERIPVQSSPLIEIVVYDTGENKGMNIQKGYP